MEVIEEGSAELAAGSDGRRRLVIGALAVVVVGLVVVVGVSRRGDVPDEVAALDESTAPVDVAVLDIDVGLRVDGPVELSAVDDEFRLQSGPVTYVSTDAREWSPLPPSDGVLVTAQAVERCAGPAVRVQGRNAAGEVLPGEVVRLDIPGIANDACISARVREPIISSLGWVAVIEVEVGGGFSDADMAGPWLVPIVSSDGETWVGRRPFAGELADVQSDATSTRILSWSDRTGHIRVTELALTDLPADITHTTLYHSGDATEAVAALRFSSPDTVVGVGRVEGRPAVVSIAVDTGEETLTPSSALDLGVFHVDDLFRLTAIDAGAFGGRSLTLMATTADGAIEQWLSIDNDERLAPVAIARRGAVVVVALVDPVFPGGGVRLKVVDLPE